MDLILTNETLPDITLTSEDLRNFFEKKKQGNDSLKYFVSEPSQCPLHDFFTAKLAGFSFKDTFGNVVTLNADGVSIAKVALAAVRQESPNLLKLIFCLENSYSGRLRYNEEFQEITYIAGQYKGTEYRAAVVIVLERYLELVKNVSECKNGDVERTMDIRCL